MKKKIGLIFTISAIIIFMPLMSHALDVKPAYMKVGDGATFTTLSIGGGWQTMMSVGPITIPANVVCVVTGSAIVGLLQPGDLIQTTISTQPATRGPWVEIAENDGFVSTAMVQAFVVERNTPTTFYMNGNNFSNINTIMTENTRIWVSCQQGSTIPTSGESAASAENLTNYE